MISSSHEDHICKISALLKPFILRRPPIWIKSQNISLELSAVNARLFNCFLKQRCFARLWKVSTVYLLLGIRSIETFSLLEFIISKKFIEHIKNSLPSDNYSIFRSVRSIADVLTLITHGISEAQKIN